MTFLSLDIQAEFIKVPSFPRWTAFDKYCLEGVHGREGVDGLHGNCVVIMLISGFFINMVSKADKTSQEVRDCVTVAELCIVKLLSHIKFGSHSRVLICFL